MTASCVLPATAGTLLTIGEMAARTGVAASALRFYEERGLICSARSESGHRRFVRATVRRVTFIAFAQRIGLTLDEIRAAMDQLPHDRAPVRAEWEALTSMWRERVEMRIAELERLKNSLSDCIGCGCLSLERCGVLNPGDRLASEGAGPRYWVGDPAAR